MHWRTIDIWHQPTLYYYCFFFLFTSAHAHTDIYCNYICMLFIRCYYYIACAHKSAQNQKKKQYNIARDSGHILIIIIFTACIYNIVIVKLCMRRTGYTFYFLLRNMVEANNFPVVIVDHLSVLCVLFTQQTRSSCPFGKKFMVIESTVLSSFFFLPSLRLALL